MTLGIMDIPGGGAIRGITADGTTLGTGILGTIADGTVAGMEAGTAAGMVLIGAAGITHTTTMLTHRTIIITDALHQEDTLLAEATTKAI